MTPNQSEGTKLTEVGLGEWGTLPEVILTNGKHRTVATRNWKDYGENPYYCDDLLLCDPVRQFDPIDPCGCGDQFAATFGLALAAIRQSRSTCGATCLLPRRSVGLAIQLAQLAAGLQTQRIGASPIRAAELLDEIGQVEEN
jgi:sugar/nucleoside kinase (ribokinase family)